MNTVIIAVESPSRSFVEKQIRDFLPSSCKVLDVFGDVDNLIEAPLDAWAKVLQKLTDKMGQGIRTRCFFAYDRDPLDRVVPKYLRAMTFVRLQSCEEDFYPVMFTDPPRHCGPALELAYGRSKQKIDDTLQQLSKSKDVGDFSICCGHGIGFSPGILIDALYESVFRLRHVIERLHGVLNHRVKTTSYISMR